jgi:lipopolysaccharide transport system ATP-binding protein
MNDIVLRVENLSKVYRLGTYDPYLTLRLSARHILRRIKRCLLLQPPPPPFQPPNGNLLWALNDVSFEVKHGEAIGIIGRNGAGKSTLLKILSRITRPSRGYADVYGRLGALLEVGTGFHPELTGRENIYLNATILGMSQSEIKARFDEIVAFAEVERFIDTPVK